jgi:hypothetical protein
LGQIGIEARLTDALSEHFADVYNIHNASNIIFYVDFTSLKYHILYLTPYVWLDAVLRYAEGTAGVIVSRPRFLNKPFDSDSIEWNPSRFTLASSFYSIQSLASSAKFAGLLRKSFECRNILSILLAAPPISLAGFPANEGLRRSLSFGLVCHVQAMAFDDSVQMLPPILAKAKTMNLFDGVVCKGPQLTAIGARAGEIRLLPPIPRRLRWMFAALEHKLRAIVP